MKIHDFSWILMNFHGKSMKFHGFSEFPGVSWEIWVYISSNPPRCVQAYLARQVGAVGRRAPVLPEGAARGQGHRDEGRAAGLRGAAVRAWREHGCRMRVQSFWSVEKHIWTLGQAF